MWKANIRTKSFACVVPYFGHDKSTFKKSPFMSHWKQHTPLSVLLLRQVTFINGFYRLSHNHVLKNQWISATVCQSPVLLHFKQRCKLNKLKWTFDPFNAEHLVHRWILNFPPILLEQQAAADFWRQQKNQNKAIAKQSKFKMSKKDRNQGFTDKKRLCLAVLWSVNCNPKRDLKFCF